MGEELRFEQIFDRMLDAVLLVDRETKIIYANPAVRLFGYSPPELIGKSVVDFISEKYKEYIYRLANDFIEGKRDFARFEIEIPEKGGNKRWTDVVVSRIDESKAVMQIRDITEFKKTQRDLEESRKMYKTIFEAYPEFMGIIDSEGKILSVNRNFLKQYKVEEREIVGRSILSFVHPEDLEKARTLLKKAIETGETVRDTLKVFIKGEEAIVDISARFVKIQRSSFGIVISKDITEKTKLEKEIRRREELYRKIIDGTLSGFLLVEDSKIVFANKAAEEITGYSQEELLGKSLEIFFEPEISSYYKKAVEEVLEGKKIDLISRFRRKDGSLGYARIQATLMDYEGRKFILVSFEDVSEKKEIEKKLKERNIMYKTLVESSHTGIFIIQNNKIVYANEITGKILGYTIDEVNSLPHPYEIIAPEFRRVAIERYMAREMGLDVPEEYELKVITKDGKEKWLSVRAKQIKYRGAPAVLVNIADITKLKEGEETLKRMNILLRVVGEIKGMLIQENSENAIFSKLKQILEKLDADVGIYFRDSGTLKTVVSPNNPIPDLINKIMNLTDVTQEFLGGRWITLLPISEGTRVVIAVARDSKFTDEELQVLKTVLQDVSMRLRALKIEKEKDMALRLITENLEHFEELADKLRNPLAIIKGYLEIRGEVPEEVVIKNISEHADRIEKILDELRVKEILTYNMKKVLETRSSN